MKVDICGFHVVLKNGALTKKFDAFAKSRKELMEDLEDQYHDIERVEIERIYDAPHKDC